MPATLDFDNPLSNQTLVKTGMTLGNGHIFEVPDNAVAIMLTLQPTSAGSATVKFSLDEAEPTDFTGFIPVAYGAVTAATAFELPGGLRWVGVDPASGTWTSRVRFVLGDRGA